MRNTTRTQVIDFGPVLPCGCHAAPDAFTEALRCPTCGGYITELTIETDVMEVGPVTALWVGGPLVEIPGMLPERALTMGETYATQCGHEIVRGDVRWVMRTPEQHAEAHRD